MGPFSGDESACANDSTESPPQGPKNGDLRTPKLTQEHLRREPFLFLLPSLVNSNPATLKTVERGMTSIRDMTLCKNSLGSAG